MFVGPLVFVLWWCGGFADPSESLPDPWLRDPVGFRQIRA